MNATGLARHTVDELIASIDAALHALHDAPPLPEEAVHDTRKAIKKARAALRLLRAGFGEAAFRVENAALRDAGRHLASIRDATSLVDALDAFRDGMPAGSAPLDRLAEGLRARREKACREFFAAPTRLRDCVRLLETTRAHVRKWRSNPVSPSSIASDLGRVHRAGRKSLARAKHDRTPVALHEWRKQVKYLGNALKALDVSGSRSLAKAQTRAGELEDCLGDDHDLAELSRYICGEAAGELDTLAKSKLVKRLDRRRASLQKRAWVLGAKIYDEKSRRFAARLTAKCESARASKTDASSHNDPPVARS